MEWTTCKLRRYFLVCFAINLKEQTQVIDTLYRYPLSPKLFHHQLIFGSMSPLMNDGLFSPTL
jgi:hypothetical protein